MRCIRPHALDSPDRLAPPSEAELLLIKDPRGHPILTLEISKSGLEVLSQQQAAINVAFFSENAPAFTQADHNYPLLSQAIAQVRVVQVWLSWLALLLFFGDFFCFCGD